MDFSATNSTACKAVEGPSTIKTEMMSELMVPFFWQNGRDDQFLKADTLWQTRLERAWNFNQTTEDEQTILE